MQAEGCAGPPNSSFHWLYIIQINIFYRKEHLIIICEQKEGEKERLVQKVLHESVSLPPALHFKARDQGQTCAWHTVNDNSCPLRSQPPKVERRARQRSSGGSRVNKVRTQSQCGSQEGHCVNSSALSTIVDADHRGGGRGWLTVNKQR